MTSDEEFQPEIASHREFSAPYQARYGGICRNCALPYHPNEMVVSDGVQVVHASCVEER